MSLAGTSIALVRTFGTIWKELSRLSWVEASIRFEEAASLGGVKNVFIIDREKKREKKKKKTPLGRITPELRKQRWPIR